MIYFVTIVVNGMPYITRHYYEFIKLDCSWRWLIVEGTSLAIGDTSWCQSVMPRLSEDGTHEYLSGLAKLDNRVEHIYNYSWPGKAAQINAALDRIEEPGLLWQVDADEIWTAKQIEACVNLFQKNPERNCAYFWCNYFVGPGLVTTPRNMFGNYSAYEWLRVWRFRPGQEFITHEPPVLTGQCPNPLIHEETEAAGLVFDHYAYADEATIRAKINYYGYPPALLDGWRSLQRNVKWPARLADFFSFVSDEAQVIPYKT